MQLFFVSKRKTHQTPVPACAPIYAISFGPDSDGQGPCEEDNKSLYEMYYILRPPEAAA